MRVALIQFAATLDAGANRDALESLLEQIGSDEEIDLVVAPEAAMHDFGPPDFDLAAVAEPMDGPFVQFLTDQAKRLNTTIVAGMFEATDGLPFNTLVAVNPDGICGTYRKIHLYDSFGYRESERLRAGAIEPATIDVAGHRIGLMTCYDLRFPELSRALVDAGSEVLILPAAWVQGAGKLEHWTIMLRSRAIENTIPVVAAAQSGDRYVGHSMVVDGRGIPLEEMSDQPGVLRASLDFDDIERVRAENPSLANRRMRRVT